MPEIILDNEMLKAVIDTDQGTNTLAFEAQRHGRWLSLMPDIRQGNVDLAASNFLMIPYSNRIEDGIFTFEEQEYFLENEENHARHGDVRKRAWEIAEVTYNRLICTFDSTEHEDVNWPWPFEARVEYNLNNNVFSSHLRLWNRGESNMPAGLGWHPYFNRQLTEEGEPILLHLNVEGVYPDANDNRIPSGPPHPLPPNQDFSTEKLLEPDNFIDICCHGYDSNGHIIWPKSKIKLVFACSQECTHLVLFNPAAPYFAVEPVTNANNGFNLHAQGEPTSGVVVLAPNAYLEAQFDLRVELL